MTLHDRLLRLVLDRQAATALLGDIHEEATRVGRGNAWIHAQVLRHLAAGFIVLLHRKKVRMLASAALILRDAWRGLSRFPATSVLAILILTVSVAAGTVTFAVVDAVVLRPLPYDRSDRLVALFGAKRAGRTDIVSPADYYAWREQTWSFQAIAAYQVWPFRPASGGETDQITMVTTTASLFDVLRVHPALGMLFSENDEVEGRDAIAVISHALWQQAFGGAPDVLGRSIDTPDGRLTVVGVTPAGFAFPVEAPAPHLWRPLVVPPEQRTLTLSRGRGSYLQVMGRLRDGVGIEQARTDVERVSGALASEFPQLYRDWRPRTELVIDALTERVARWMRLVLAAVAVLILIACANVSNLLLARSAKRAREISVRASLGATRGQLLAHLLAESALLAAAAVAGGLLLAYWLLGAVVAALPEGIPRAESIALDARVFTAAAMACVATTFIAGLVPAWQASRVSITDALRESATMTPSRARRAAQNVFLVAQVSLVTILLVATTLLVGSFVRLLEVDLGFQYQGLLGVDFSPRIPDGPEDGRRVREFYGRVVETARGVPGVTNVAMSAQASLPLYNGFATTRLSSPRSDAPPVTVDQRQVSGDYFAAAGIPLLRGRSFVENDRDQPVAIIDELAARHVFGDRNPIGQRVILAGRYEHTVIGVAQNVRLRGPEGLAQAQVYRPMEDEQDSRTLLVRTSIAPEQVVPILEAQLTALLPPKTSTITVDIVEDQYRLLTADRRFNAGMMSALGVLALVIGVGGIYASTATMVAQRTKEIGIRMALGATTRRVVGAVTLSAGRFLLIGAALGIVAAWAISGLFQSIVFGLAATDLVAYAVPLTLIAAGGALAALLPARRAARVDPLTTLRSE